MDKTYAWHSGADGVAPQWGLPVALMPDELFSGWLIRVALTQGCSLSTLMASIWPGLRFRDVDRGMPKQQLAVLSRRAGIHELAMQEAMLTKSEGVISRALPRRRSIWSWILPLGLQVTRHPAGFQYCPACWAEDVSPYVRLQWRFAWHIACEPHKIVLRDRCYQCDEPIRLYRSQSMHHCSVCGADLCVAPQVAVGMDALHLQRAADHVLQARSGLAWGAKLKAADWFQLLALLVSFFRREAAKESEKLTVFACELDRIRRLDKLRLELLRVEERQMVLALIDRALAMPREVVMGLISDAGYSRQALVTRVHRLSPSLKLGWQLFPDKSVSPRVRARYAPRSRHLVKAMMMRLCRRLRESP